MKIRASLPADTPAIIELLRQSLGESTIPKSEALWSWKHEQNPFGASYILLAEEDGQLIGLRAFMQWQWLWNGKTYTAIRAVDTATHPAHQGKGIFKKLTLQQAELCKQQGVDFVFNTPNKQSKPGYLKMGWMEQGRMPLKVKFLWASVFLSAIGAKKNKQAETQQQWALESIDFEKSKIIAGTLSTKLTAAYITWRYAKNPLFNYHYFTDGKTYFIITRIKPNKYTNELRIAEFILLNEHADVKNTRKQIKKELNAYCKQQNVGFISLSGQQQTQYKKYFSWMGMMPVRPLGPMITLKDLNMNSNFSSLMNMNNWTYSLGDLELF